jgi:parallel beta helix pectate lyase-like protein
MGRALSHVGCVLAVALTLTTDAVAGTLYVAPSGSDANPGTLAAPLATPAKALTLAAAGDTILLRAGTYTITRSLSITKPGLTLRSYPGERAKIVAGTGDLTNLTSVAVVYASRVTIEDLELQGASYYGIKLDDRDGPQSGITIRRVHIHHTGRDGIKAQSVDGLVIEVCEIAFTGVRDPGNAEGIDVMGSIGATVRRNYVHDIATTGIFVKAGTRQAVIEANRVERTGHAGILLGSESEAQYMRNGALHEAIDSTARNNIVVDTALAGLGSIAGDNVRFENNTVINAAKTAQAVFRAAPNEYKTQPRNILLKNNVLVLAASSTRPMIHLYGYAGAILSDSNTWFSPNGKYGFWRDSASGPNSYFTSLDQWRSAMNADGRSRVVDPRLNAAELYRPFPGSPALDTGETLAEVTSDYSGALRPQGSASDIGAHEGTVAMPLRAPTGLRVVKD